MKNGGEREGGKMEKAMFFYMDFSPGLSCWLRDFFYSEFFYSCRTLRMQTT